MKTLINDDRLTADMDRIRNGSTQLFRRKGLDNKFTDEENADVILTHENRSFYAELIDGQWFWVNGCSECNGKPRDWMTYIECDEHNVCRSCNCTRSDLTEPPWGGKNGWICKPCADIENKLELEIQMTKFNKLDSYDFEFNDTIICPHCGTDNGCDDFHESASHDCHLCNKEFHVEVDYSVSYTTSKEA